MASEHKRSAWRTWIWSVVVMIAVTVMYVLSYAPVLRWHYPVRTITEISRSIHIPIYSPVEWLLDTEFASSPLLWWSQLWGVREQTKRASALRNEGVWEIHPSADGS